MIGTVDVKLQAHNPNFPLDPVFSFVNSPQNFRIRNVPKSIGKWNITNVYVNITYPDETVISNEGVLVGGIWNVTTNGSSLSGIVEKGFVVLANGKDEYENTVTGYVLGVGDIIIKELDGTIEPGIEGNRMTLLDGVPTQPNEGDVYKKNGLYYIWQNGQENPLNEGVSKQYVDIQIQNVENEIPTKTSELTNDSDFTTQTYVDGALRYDIYPVPSETLLLKDRACNTFSPIQDTTFVVPTLTSIYDKCMDFLLCLTISQGTVPDISFTRNGAARRQWAFEGDTFPKPDSEGLWLYSFTKIDSSTLAVSLKKLNILPF